MAQEKTVVATNTETEAIKRVVVEKVHVGLGGWLSFVIVMLGLNAVGWIWAFFIAIAAMAGGASGVGLGVAIETLIFALGLIGLNGFTLLLMANRKKLSVLMSYITLGVSALFTTIVAITTMFTSYQNCSTDYSSYYSWTPSCTSVGLPASVIILLIGVIFVAWASAVLMAYYFKKSERVRLTLNQ